MSPVLKLAGAGTVAVVMMFAVPSALAHGDLVRTIPKADSVLDEVPDHVLLEFSQRPQKGARITVLDGCRADVVRTLQLQGDTAHIEIGPLAQPGHFRVAYRIVSAVDGDATRGNYAFHVRGKRDCSAEPEPPVVPSDAPPIEDAAARETEPASTSQTLFLGALGTIGLAGIGLILRRGREVA